MIWHMGSSGERLRVPVIDRSRSGCRPERSINEVRLTFDWRC